MRAQEGAEIVIRKWMHLHFYDRLVIVAGKSHKKDAQVLKDCAEKICRTVVVLTVMEEGRYVGVFFDANENIFSPYTAVLAVTEYSIVTTRAARKAIKKRKKFLSLPMSTRDGKSLLTYEFLKMDTGKSRMMAGIMKSYLAHAEGIKIVTAAGTDLVIRKHGRKPGFFNGDIKDGRGYSSASIEIYIPIEETQTEGTMIVDGSFGYIGRPETPVKVQFQSGRVCAIEDNAGGERLKAYMASYSDPDIYVAGELGIGLNTLSKCRGRCYVEDESAYGTFHIGLGRNIALGGKLKATGHFDLVALEPTLFADNRKLIDCGRISLPAPLPY